MLGALCSSAGWDVEKERLLSNQPGELRDSVLSAGLTVRACMGNIEYVTSVVFPIMLNHICFRFQIYYYHNVKCRVEMFDKDVIMLQVKN